MASPGWRGVFAAFSVALLAAAPMAVGTIGTPAVSAACLPGETGVTNGCASFCLPGLQLDTQTGLCLKVPPPVSPNRVATPLL
ncbi:hypothetical protein [Mycolicibacterium sp. XJ870]